jgi:hypothetical protein
MSNENKAFSRAPTASGNFAPRNDRRTTHRSNPQRCRRQMRTGQKAPLADPVAMSEANSLGDLLTFPPGSVKPRQLLIEAETAGLRADLEVEIAVGDMRILGCYAPDHFVSARYQRWGEGDTKYGSITAV